MKQTLLLVLMGIIGLPAFPGMLPQENPCGIMYPRGGDEDWGIGAYYLPDSFEMEVYTEGEYIGTLSSSGLTLRSHHAVSDVLAVHRKDLEYVGHFSFELLKVKEFDEDGNAVILWSENREGLCIPREELEKRNCFFFTYQELLQGKIVYQDDIFILNETSIGVNVEQNCLNLRRRASIDSEVLTCIPGNDWAGEKHTHFDILDWEGFWAFVEAKTYAYNEALDEAGEGCGYEVVESKVGWVKAIDDTGFPNIWFAVSSY